MEQRHKKGVKDENTPKKKKRKIEELFGNNKCYFSIYIYFYALKYNIKGIVCECMF